MNQFPFPLKLEPVQPQTWIKKHKVAMARGQVLRSVVPLTSESDYESAKQPLVCDGALARESSDPGVDSQSKMRHPVHVRMIET